jgi:uncharacterized protein YjdB
MRAGPEGSGDMPRFGNTLATVVAVALSSWSCGSTAPDAARQVATIIVTPATSTLVLNAQLPLQAQVQDASGASVPDAAVTWTVQDPKIVSVSAAGVVTALAVGSSQVAANAFGKSGLAVITVTKPPVASVRLQPDQADVAVGATLQLSASALDGNGTAMPDRAIAWTTSDAAVASVNGSGLVTGVAAGTATITAVSEGKSSNATVTVSQVVARVDVNPASASLVAGQSRQLVATPRDTRGNVVTGRAVVWTSDNSAIAAVHDGNVTASKTGVATITATVDGVKSTARITVTPGAVATVTVTAPSNSLNVRSTMQLTATAKDDQGNTVPDQNFLWSTSSIITATVSANGIVTARRGGVVTITAQTIGVSGSVTIDVQ